MFDFETATKTAQDSAAKINSAAVEFTRSILESTQKSYASAVEAVQANPANGLYREWLDLFQDQAKAFTAAATKVSKK
jgi:hypothetical protein